MPVPHRRRHQFDARARHDQLHFRAPTVDGQRHWRRRGGRGKLGWVGLLARHCRRARGGCTLVNRQSLTMLQPTGMVFFGLMGSTGAVVDTLTLSAATNCVGIGFRR
jgi:hypothetical protein